MNNMLWEIKSEAVILLKKFLFVHKHCFVYVAKVSLRVIDKTHAMEDKRIESFSKTSDNRTLQYMVPE